MTKYFGMEYCTVGDLVKISDRYGIDDIHDFAWNQAMGNDNYVKKLYIHPDSLRLLEPVYGDVCELDIVDNIREPKAFAVYTKPFPDYVKKYITIMRDGVAFMWPEMEK